MKSPISDSAPSEILSKPDWRWQMRNRISSLSELENIISLTDEEKRGISGSARVFRWKITPYYASLMNPKDPECPIRKQVVPHEDELLQGCEEYSLDPLEELAHSPAKNLIHNYKDRVAFCISTECPSFCRFCLRKRMVGHSEQNLRPEEYEEAIQYISSHTEIRDVLLTGGDPLTLGDDTLISLITTLRNIPHVDIIRLGTRYPVLNPFRITGELCRRISELHPVWINTHFNHPAELTPQAAEALHTMVDAGIPVGNQTVLLKGINNDESILRELFQKLVTHRVRPYYLYQSQSIEGTRHFQTTIEEGMEIMEKLRGTLTGFAIPLYVLDTPYGKVPLNPHGYKGRQGNYVQIRSYSGKIWQEFNPE
ncbi:KamA family radical SAM protein [Balneolaceae bacterium ANBcel3]|nr:KamA family radical SAM protein [Balneolaceae bacterium ANBcel3]